MGRQALVLQVQSTKGPRRGRGLLPPKGALHARCSKPAPGGLLPKLPAWWQAGRSWQQAMLGGCLCCQVASSSWALTPTSFAAWLVRLTTAAKKSLNVGRDVKGSSKSAGLDDEVYADLGADDDYDFM